MLVKEVDHPMTKRLLTVWLASGVLMFGVVHDRVSQATSVPSKWHSLGGIPQWPWKPGGASYTPGLFVATPYPIQQVTDAMLPQGQRVVIHPGAQGTTFQMGGSRVVVVPSTPATVADGTAPVYQVTIGGVKYAYDRVMSMMTTAYNGSLAMNGPSGAVAAWDGKPLKPGDVAVDPRVIPLGTYLYIDGYGPARAVDTGSAVWGDHVDLFFQESSARVSGYGIQFHKVYMLTGRPHGFNG